MKAVTRQWIFLWCLILESDFSLRYIVSPKAVHLVVSDHSAKLWLTVESIYREVEHAKQWLSRHHAELAARISSVK